MKCSPARAPGDEQARLLRENACRVYRLEDAALYRLRGEKMKRYGAILGIKSEHIAEYKRLHAAVWPEVPRAASK